MLYPDTSFIVSLLNPEDANYNEARSRAKNLSGGLVICEVHLLEFPAAVRGAIHRKIAPIATSTAQRLLDRFHYLLNTESGWKRKNINLAATVQTAADLGERYGWNRRQTAFDLWHLAAAIDLRSTVFLSFDKRQLEVANQLEIAT